MLKPVPTLNYTHLFQKAAVEYIAEMRFIYKNIPLFFLNYN